MSDLERLKMVAWKESDSTAARFFMRPLSIRMTKILLPTGIGPTSVTVAAFVVRVIACLLFPLNLYLFTFLAGLLVYFSHVLDCVDGELARAKKATSRSGALLDYFLDRLADIVLYTSITISLLTSTGKQSMLLLGMLVMGSTFFMTDVGQATAGLRGRIQTKRRKASQYFYYGGSANTMIILIASVLDQLFVGMLLIGILSFAFTVVRFLEAYMVLRDDVASGIGSQSRRDSPR
jgi:phosphatidylglycerophosphate synthase